MQCISSFQQRTSVYDGRPLIHICECISVYLCFVCLCVCSRCKSIRNTLEIPKDIHNVGVLCTLDLTSNVILSCRKEKRGQTSFDLHRSRVIQEPGLNKRIPAPAL